MVLTDKGKKIAIFQAIFFTIVILERCDIFLDTTFGLAFGTRKVKILTRLLYSQVTHRNKRASNFTLLVLILLNRKYILTGRILLLLRRI